MWSLLFLAPRAISRNLWLTSVKQASKKCEEHVFNEPVSPRRSSFLMDSAERRNSWRIVVQPRSHSLPPSLPPSFTSLTPPVRPNQPSDRDRPSIHPIPSLVRQQYLASKHYEWKHLKLSPPENTEYSWTAEGEKRRMECRDQRREERDDEPWAEKDERCAYDAPAFKPNYRLSSTSQPTKTCSAMVHFAKYYFSIYFGVTSSPINGKTQEHNKGNKLLAPLTPHPSCFSIHISLFLSFFLPSFLPLFCFLVKGRLWDYPSR